MLAALCAGRAAGRRRTRERQLRAGNGGRPLRRRDFTPAEVLREPVFWLMYLMFVLVGAGGLMATAQLAVIATDFGVADVPVTLLGLTLPALTFALSIDRVLNGLTRPFFGWVSDRIGRENTMFIAFRWRALGILALVPMPRDPVCLRAAVRAGVLRLGRDLQPVPGHLRRHVRPPLRHHQLRPALHRQGHRGADRAARQPAAGRHRQLAGGVLPSPPAVNLLAAVLALFVLRPMRRRLLARAALHPAPCAVSALA